MDLVKVKSQSDSAAGSEHGRTGQKRGRPQASDASSSKRPKMQGGEPLPKTHEEEGPKFTQPPLITGATLKDYQLEGVAWMVSLYENGISGILGECLFSVFHHCNRPDIHHSADEMGLGKVIFLTAMNILDWR